MSSSSGERTTQYLRFAVAAENYAISLLDVQEIVALSQFEIVEVPKSPDYFKGILNVRGVSVPLLDLRKRLLATQEEKTRGDCAIVVRCKVRQSELLVGLIVDAVEDVIWLGSDQLQTPPLYSQKLESSYIQALAKFKDATILLLNADALIELSPRIFDYASSVLHLRGEENV